jgi:hypothetical protein
MVVVAMAVATVVVTVAVAVVAEASVADPQTPQNTKSPQMRALFLSARVSVAHK